MNISLAPEWLPSFVTPFVTLSYPTDPPVAPDSFKNSSYYGAGLLDGCLIITCIAIMAILRDALRLGVFEPFARWYLLRQLKKEKAREVATPQREPKKTSGEANGNADTKKVNGAANGNGHAAGMVITKQEARKMRRSVLRFAEQGWSFVYYTLQWLFGLYVHWNLPTSVWNPVAVWENYPHIPLAGPLKFYYLTQSAFYLHQILIINAEARRKDHWQMMTHHVITVVLILGSYSYNFTRVGCLIMMLMDLCDIYLPLAKMFRYLAFSTCCDVTFGLWMVSWLVSRHVLFIRAIISTYYDAPRIIPHVWDPAAGHFVTKDVLRAFNALLICLQIIQLIWFWMICRVAWRVIKGQGAEDTRSDSEDGAYISDEEVKKDQ